MLLTDRNFVCCDPLFKVMSFFFPILGLCTIHTTSCILSIWIISFVSLYICPVHPAWPHMCKTYDFVHFEQKYYCKMSACVVKCRKCWLELKSSLVCSNCYKTLLIGPMHALDKCIPGVLEYNGYSRWCECGSHGATCLDLKDVVPLIPCTASTANVEQLQTHPCFSVRLRLLCYYHSNCP